MPINSRRAELTDPEARTLERCEDRLAKTIALMRVSELAFAEASGEHMSRLVASTVHAAVGVLNKGGAVDRVIPIALAVTDFAGTLLTHNLVQFEVAARRTQALARRRLGGGAAQNKALPSARLSTPGKGASRASR